MNVWQWARHGVGPSVRHGVGPSVVAFQCTSCVSSDTKLITTVMLIVGCLCRN